MPVKPIYGDPLGRLLADIAKLPTLPTTQQATAPIQEDQFFRNGMHPTAVALSKISEAGNQALLYRSKEAFRYLGPLSSSNAIASFGVGARDRWRFAFHTSPYHGCLFGRVVMQCQTAGFSTDSYCRVAILNGGGSVVVSQDIHYGTSPAGPNLQLGWQYLRVQDIYLEGLAKDTDYYGLITDYDYGIVVAISLADMNSLSENGGYLAQNYTSLTSITEAQHGNINTLIKNQWKRGGATLFNWTANDQSAPQQISTAIATNLIDATSTTYGSAIPGFYLDLTNHDRVSQAAGVPCVMKVYGKFSAAGPNGTLELRNSAGTVVASIANGWTSTASWQSVAFNMPASADKYYLTFSRASAGIFSCYAVSIYEYE